MKKMILLMFVLFVISNSLFAWDLAYSHDKYGNATGGSKNILINAIKEGLDIRVVIDRSQYGSGFNSLIPMHVAYINNQIIGCVLSTSGNASTAFYNCYWQFNTNGNVSMERYTVSNNANRGKSNERCSIKWYINY